MRAVVLGSGWCFWDDCEAAGWDEARQAWAEPSVVFAVNDMIRLMTTMEIRHGVSHHQDKLPHWLRLREGPRRKTESIQLHSSAPHDGVHKVWAAWRSGGSSTLLAVRIARAMGHERVIVVGTPLDDRGYLWSNPKARHKDFARYRKAWVEAVDELRGHVCAPSGFLRELLGWPLAEAA